MPPRRSKTRMRTIRPFLLALLVSVLCSCDKQFHAKITGAGTTNATVVQADAIVAADEFMKFHGHTNVGIGEYFTCYDYYRFRYSTNGTALPDAVYVDRRTGRVGFEWKWD